jgi:hypothetical protein
MIITKKINFKVKSSRDISYLKQLGYKSKIGDNILIPIKKLSIGSHRLVTVRCCNCKKEKEVRYQAYNKVTNNNQNKYYCSNKECTNKKRVLSNKKKYGVSNVFELADTKNKIKDTCLKKYGVENPQQDKEIKMKTILTNLERYGVENVFQSEKIKEKIKITNLEKYGVEYPQQSEYIRSKYSALHKSSKVEIELLNFIKDNYSNKIIPNSKKIIMGYELDVYLPDLKLAFEFNGLYWHNELNKDKNYHLNKTELCENKSINLTHIWEDDWEFKKDIVKSIILNKIGVTNNRIFARKCDIREVDTKLYRSFLTDNHLQGYVTSSIKIGLYYNNELVSVMGIGKKRKIMNGKNDDTFEMYRFCNKLNTNILGGFSKLFTYFLKNYNYPEIISYVDRSYFNGDGYRKIGFKLVSKTAPNYHYIVGRKREYRFKYRKDVLVKGGFDPNKSEREIMLERKIYKIYNSGNLKFIFKE